jgi:hypothetical protein
MQMHYMHKKKTTKSTEGQFQFSSSNWGRRSGLVFVRVRVTCHESASRWTARQVVLGKHLRDGCLVDHFSVYYTYECISKCKYRNGLVLFH